MEQCAEEEVVRDPLVIFHVERSFAFLAILSLLHLCLFSVEERVHLASSLAPSLITPPRLGAPPGAQAGGPLQRQCSWVEAATLAGGITWSLEPETSTVFLPPLPPTSPSSSSGTPGSLLERSDIMHSNLSHPPQEFVPHLGVGCSLRAMTPARMRQCLRGRGLLFVGDSVSRYQYLGLAQALETGLHVAWDPPSEHDNFFGTWANFYAATTERLGGHSHCDCWRPPNDWPQSVCRGGVCGWAVSGNRYYRWEEEGLEVNFLETLGGAKDPPLGVFHAPQSYFGFHCNSSNPQDSAGACLASGAPPLCSPGWCSSPPEHVEPMWDAIRTLVRMSSPAFMVLNSGIWGIQWGQDGRLEALMSALDWAALPQREGGGGVKSVVWKTTTQQLTDLQKPPNYQEWWPWENFDAHLLATQREDLVVAEFEKRGWLVLGAAQATLPLKNVAMDATCSPETRSLIFLDGIHYARSIYRGLNEILMTMLCAEGN